MEPAKVADEKTGAVQTITTVEVNELQESLEGYILDPALYPDHAAGLQTTPDGKCVLIPQPSDNVHDPLNWSPRRKAVMLAIVGYIAALADYSGSTVIINILPQAMEWQMSPAAVQRAVVGDIFMIGACGLFVVALASYFGRLPVTLVFQAVCVATSIWSALATNFNSYLAARIVNGFFCSVGQGGVLMWIKDLFFFHEHPRAINYVEFGVVASPYLGPLIGAFIISTTTWRWTFWLCTILSVISFVLVFFMEETLFDRSKPADPHVAPGSRLRSLLGIEQAKTWHQRSFLQSMLRPVVAITKLPVLLTSIYYLLNFAWVIGVNATVSIWLEEFYGFGPRGIGYFYFFGIIGPLIGWFAGHWMHDSVARLYAQRYGRIDPESRLIIAYPATLVLVVALLVLGFALEYRWHYTILAVFCCVQCIGIMVVTTATNAYLLDCYPEGAGEVGAWISASRNWSGFMATFIQIEWVTKAGPARAFGAEAGITIASMLILVVLQLFGKRIRKAQGRMVFGKAM